MMSETQAEIGADVGSLTIESHVSDGLAQVRIPSNSGGWLAPITKSERGRELARRRWDKNYERKTSAVMSGMANASVQLPGIDGRSTFKYVAYLAEQMAMHAANPGERGAVSAAEWLMRHGFPEPARGSGENSVIALDPALQELSAMWTAARDADPELARRARELLARRNGGG